jgi:urease accessory protein UreF
MRLPEQSAPGPSTDIARSEAGNLLGEFSALLQQIGAPSVISHHGMLHLEQITDLPSLKVFLENYVTKILLPLELPAIARACHHSLRGETRELIELDRQIASEPLLECFASASRTIGRSQLRRLRPLRDQRLAQRYLNAVEAGQAQAWHTLVYGLMLAIYSWPLRQGLLNYSRETLASLAQAAARARKFPAAATQEIVETLFLRLPEAIEATVMLKVCDVRA